MASHPSAGHEGVAKLGLTALINPEERRLAGRVSGLLYLTAAVSVPALLLPAPWHPALWIVLGEVLVATLWGLACLTIVPWDRAPAWISHASSVGGLVLTGVLVAASGGTRSPASMYILFVVVFAAYFYPRREATAFIVACAAVRAMPLLYDPAAIRLGILSQLPISAATYFVTGGAIIGGRSLVNTLRARSAALSAQRGRLSDQHASLRRVATAVATASPPRAVFTLVASEARRLLEADAAAVMRYDGDHVELVGSHGGQNAPYPAGTRFPLRPGSELTLVRQSGKPVRTDGYEPGSRHRGAAAGWQCCVCAPVWVDESLWGGICVLSQEAWALPADTEERLLDFAHLVATSIANTERQSELARRASVDALTGLANHRAFHERLESEAARALRHTRELSLALVEVDHFKQINDELGHDTGDQVLVELARVLEGLTRKGDLLARLSADEFGLLLPETDKRSAFIVLERARQIVARTPLAGVASASFTAGICDLESAGGEGSLYRMADAALHWGKARGRAVSWIYDPEVVPAIFGSAKDLEGAHAMAGLKALSRAIDAKDPLTREHSERVAALAVRLAEAIGWQAERIELLESAALVHDVGKIGVPDAILLKPDRLEPEEYEVVKQHASLGAQIVEGVLAEEQVDWVRSHHERPDGHGYPNGLLGASISEGARLLAMADAFDAMTSSNLRSPQGARGRDRRVPRARRAPVRPRGRRGARGRLREGDARGSVSER